VPQTPVELFPPTSADDLFNDVDLALDLASIVDDAESDAAREQRERARDAALSRAVGKLASRVGSTSASQRDKYLLLERFHHAYLMSSCPAKRGILYQGVLGFFRDEFLTSGWSNILWERLVALEPAEVMFLLTIREAKGSLRVPDSEPEAELVERLSRSGLVSRNIADPRVVYLRGAAAKLLDFLSLG
jgi:hypothetical protein